MDRSIQLIWIVCAAVLVIAEGVQAEIITIDTTTSPNLGAYIGHFGEGLTPVVGDGVADTYGQTFTIVGSHTVLNTFSFFIYCQTAEPVEFGFFVAEWDGLKAVGPVLYESPMVSTTTNGGELQFEQITFSPGQLRHTG